MSNNNLKWATDNECKYKMTDIYMEVLNENNIYQTKNDDWTIYFPCTYDETFEEIKKLKEKNLTDPNKKIFIIQNADQIASKSDLWINICNKYGINKAKKMCPMTYVLYDKNQVNQFKLDYDPNKIYILKKNIQRQEGLKITKNKDEILNANIDGFIVVQELLQNPFIINDRKINLRCYVLVVCDKGNQSVYIYQDGFMYYTKHPFINNSLNFWSNITTGYIDRWVYHINPLTHKDFRKYLQKNGIADSVVFNNIYELIKDLMASVDVKFCKDNDFKFCTTFQLFGVDIAVNDDLSAKIIECNKGPNLNINDERDGQLKKSLVKDIFKVLGIIKNDYNDFVQIN
jgi:hypothetical protein